MKTTRAKGKVIVHETQEDCKIEDHHFVNNKDLIKEIRKKAYEIYESRGSVAGNELEDWLEAERIVAAEEEK